MLWATIMGVIVGCMTLVFWLDVAFKKSIPPSKIQIATTEEMMEWVRSLAKEEERPGAVYEYIEDGVTKEARPGTETHRMIEEVVRRK